MAGGAEMDGRYVVRYIDPRVQQLFEHARNAIEMGVEDYQASFKDARRLMSAVRNFDSGLELLCKTEVASTRFNDIYVKDKDGSVKLVGGHPVTIGMREIRSQFSRNWPCGIYELTELHEYRNFVEHFYPQNPHDAWDHLGRAFIWLSTFFEKVLARKPERDFTPRVWLFLSSLKSIVEEAQAKMEEEFSELDLPDAAMVELAPYHFVCPRCRAMVAEVVDAKNLLFRCGRCSQGFTYAQLVDAVYPNCYCEFCGNALVDESELDVFYRTEMCGLCEHKLS